MYADPIVSGALRPGAAGRYDLRMTQEIPMSYDVVIIGGGPAGLSAALALGRARKRVLLCDAGPRRNAAAIHLHNFVTRDGTRPDDFRAIAREQLALYPSVVVQDVAVQSISGERGAFEVALSTGPRMHEGLPPIGPVQAKRILVCTGMVDETLPIEGFAELWGHAIFQCPYCHGWELQDRRWGYLATSLGHLVPFALMARGWTSDLTVFTNAALDVPDEGRQQLAAAGIHLETRPIARLVAHGRDLEAVAFSDGASVPCDALFTHPPQHQVAIVRSLDLALEEGFVRVDPMMRQTSRPGIYAAGDLTSRQQGAIFAAAQGTQAAAALNHDLSAL